MAMTMAMAGGITNMPIGKKSPFEELAKWAVQEYNKKQHAQLMFVSVVLATRKVLTDGTRNCILLVAKDGCQNNLYAAMIFESAVTNCKVLEAFMKIFGGIVDVFKKVVHKFQELGSWAVDEHNKKVPAHLTFVVAVLGTEMVVTDGIRYYIVLVAKDGCQNNLYAATIFESAVTGVKVLEDFRVIFGGGVADAPLETSCA